MTLLLKLLRPKNIPTRKFNWNWRVRLYHWLLVKLMPLYKRCAISDTINFDNMQVVHSVRDYWYEEELQRFHIDTAQHLEKRSLPLNSKHEYRRSALFKWSDSLLVFKNGESVKIKRAKNYVIETDIKGQLKLSSEKDFILRSEFISKNNEKPAKRHIESEQSHSAQSDENSSDDKEKRHPKQKINIKDTIPPQKISNAPQPSITKYRGFDENNIF